MIDQHTKHVILYGFPSLTTSWGVQIVLLSTLYYDYDFPIES